MKAKKFNKNAVICLAAGKSQVSIIHKAKSLGYSVVVIDKNRKAPGFSYADFKIYQSTYEGDTIIKELKKLRTTINFIGILNRSSGLPVVTAAKICKYFNLPGVPIKSAKSLVNKDKMRKACAMYKIPIPSYKIYSINKYKPRTVPSLPLVIKPGLSLVGKSGVSIIHSKNKINMAIKYAEKHTINKKILIEEFLKGPDLSFISFVNDGKLLPVCLLEEINIENLNGAISPKGYRTLKADYNNWNQKAFDIATKIVTKFRIKRSPFMISLRPDYNNNLRLIEVHLDIGGDLLIEAFFPKALPFNFLKLAIEMAIGSSNYPVNFKIKPTAIFYKNGVVSNNDYKILTSNSNKMLDKQILNFKI